MGDILDPQGKLSRAPCPVPAASYGSERLPLRRSTAVPPSSSLRHALLLSRCGYW